MSFIDFGIIICSRTDSRRIPNKPFVDIGAPIINLLLKRVDADFSTFLAIPEDQLYEYVTHFRNNPISEESHWGNATLYVGSKDNPLKRMYHCAKDNDLQYIIRICHDKVYVDPDIIHRACKIMKNHKDIGYLYSSHLIDGCGFEIIRFDVLEHAFEKFGVVEHISYAARASCNELDYVTYDLGMDQIDLPEYLVRRPGYAPRLLIDYPKDLDLIKKVYAAVGNAETKDVLSYLDGDGSVYSSINELPLLSIYTCTYNSKKWLSECINSVLSLSDFNRIEYIIVDDGSTDGTSEYIHDLSEFYDNVKVVTNKQNLGLSSSCNIALENATSNYIMRLDADDYLVTDNANKWVCELSSTGYDYLTPSYTIDDSFVYPEDNNHLGGTIFKTSAINHIKFTDGLRGYDNIDFFGRALGQLNGTASRSHSPLFYYRDTPGSLSKTNLEERAKIKEALISKIKEEVIGNEQRAAQQD